MSNDKKQKTAWVFAGQGAQFASMGSDIYDAWPCVRDIYDSDAAGFSLTELSFNSSEDVLADTRYTQACIGALQAAIVYLLHAASVTQPDYTLGLSLGEYSALHCAQALDTPSLLQLLGKRGAIMAEASRIPAKMVAVLGLSDEEVKLNVQKAQAQLKSDSLTDSNEVVACANYNCPGQLVIGGTQAAVDVAIELLLAAGAKRCTPLKTSGAFHTPLMQEASSELASVLAKTTFFSQHIPVVFNAIANTASDEEVKQLLVRQMYSAVLFTQSIRYLASKDVRRIVEIGPGQVLKALIKRIAPEIEVLSISNKEQLEEAIEVMLTWQK
ncbi:MAG: ACP S-malonyltransferase [Coriobacteriales bacterium]|jgi:[acyl-carrier-protein] S-malonyltransferase|nr:ACP S-malonyltransferase [Coriobacteriales bacterium]